MFILLFRMDGMTNVRVVAIVLNRMKLKKFKK
jgi:hypothetical protein